MALSNSWSKYNSVDGLLTDIYDGRLWKELQDSTGGFTGSTVGFMLNVDWFNPFKHRMYSMGAIYLSTLNLTRPIRYKEQNKNTCWPNSLSKGTNNVGTSRI